MIHMSKIIDVCPQCQLLSWLQTHVPLTPLVPKSTSSNLENYCCLLLPEASLTSESAVSFRTQILSLDYHLYNLNKKINLPGVSYSTKWGLRTEILLPNLVAHNCCYLAKSLLTAPSSLEIQHQPWERSRFRTLWPVLVNTRHHKSKHPNCKRPLVECLQCLSHGIDVAIKQISV